MDKKNKLKFKMLKLTFIKSGCWIKHLNKDKGSGKGMGTKIIGIKKILEIKINIK